MVLIKTIDNNKNNVAHDKNLITVSNFKIVVNNIVNLLYKM